jgi:hypothetical protein
MYQKLGAKERAAHSLYSVATIWQFLGEVNRAMEAYVEVAAEYGELQRETDRQNALSRYKQLLQLR